MIEGGLFLFALDTNAIESILKFGDIPELNVGFGDIKRNRMYKGKE
jgi:hypothetical protein